MALASIENAKLRRTLLWFALVGVAVTIVLFFGGSLIGTLVGRSPAVTPTTGTLSLTVGNDADADGSIDPLSADEHPIADAEVVLASAGHTIEFETDEAGFVQATQLALGAYSVAAYVGGEQVSVVPASVTVAAGEQEVQLALNAAGKDLGAVFGYAFADSDANGAISPADAPIVGATATLTGGSAEDQSTAVTDEAGRYEFSRLVPGQYAVRVAVPDHAAGRFSERAALTTVLTVRSSIDRRRADVLLALANPTAAAPEYRLAQATSLPGITILKLASDADEVGQEFVQTTPGSDVSYEITLQAQGTSGETYSSVVVVDDYPAGTHVTSVDNGGVDNGGTITWSVGTMTAGDVVVLGYESRIDPGAEDGSYENVATVTANGTVPSEDDSIVIVSSRAAEPIGSPGSLGDRAEPTTVGDSGAAAGTTGAPGSSTVAVGVQGWQLAAAVAVPAAVVAAVVTMGFRRVRT